MSVQENPASSCASLAALFPDGVVAAELRGQAGGELLTQLLTEEERRGVQPCHESRLRDFTAGRLCARRALQQLGIHGFSLLAAADRQPLWPPQIVGSITHTEGYSAAVVARAAVVCALGVDSTVIGAVGCELWPKICTAAELQGLQALRRWSRHGAPCVPH